MREPYKLKTFLRQNLVRIRLYGLRIPGLPGQTKNQTFSASEQRKIGFPQSTVLTQRELVITQGTIDCTQHAIKYGVSLNVAGGTHHAYADMARDFVC
jgi:acetoin utilization deacetylase AcuC-like enzyme